MSASPSFLAPFLLKLCENFINSVKFEANLFQFVKKSRSSRGISDSLRKPRWFGILIRYYKRSLWSESSF